MNISDLNRCKKLVEQGKTEEEISRILKVNLESVSKTTSLFKQGVKPRKKPVEVKTAQDKEAEVINEKKISGEVKPRRKKPEAESEG